MGLIHGGADPKEQLAYEIKQDVDAAIDAIKRHPNRGDWTASEKASFIAGYVEARGHLPVPLDLSDVFLASLYSAGVS